MQFWSFFKWFECAVLVQIRNKTLDQNCVCDVNPTRDTEFNQTLFWTKNLTPTYSRKHMNSEVFSEAGEMVSN